MGRDKSLLPFRGRPLIATVAETVARAAGAATLVGNPALSMVTEFPAIPDLYPGEGPLGGILTALRHTVSDWNLVTACDMPALDPGFLNTLFEAAESCNAAVLLPVRPDGLAEPLCAIWHRRSHHAVEAAFAAGVRKVTAALDGVAIVRYRVNESAPFQNVNTPEDWSGYAAE